MGGAVTANIGNTGMSLLWYSRIESNTVDFTVTIKAKIKPFFNSHLRVKLLVLAHQKNLEQTLTVIATHSSTVSSV